MCEKPEKKTKEEIDKEAFILISLFVEKNNLDVSEKEIWNLIKTIRESLEPDKK